MTPPSRDEARDRLEKDLADDEREYPGRSFVLVFRDDVRALLSPEGQGAPVAWRVKDFADGWILFNSEAAAKHEADAMGGALMQSLVPAPPTKGGE